MPDEERHNHDVRPVAHYTGIRPFFSFKISRQFKYENTDPNYHKFIFRLFADSTASDMPV